MFWVIVFGFLFVSIRLVRDEAQPIIFKERDPVIRQFKFQYEAQKQELKQEYEKTKLPKSGYMLTEDYEKLSKGIAREDLVIDFRDKIRKSDMKYLPQPTYKLVRYNSPPGTPELNIPRKLNFDRFINMQGIVSGDFTKLVYPTVYYYAETNCTSCDVFVIPLDTNLTKIDRIKKANVAKKIEPPLFSTDKDITTDGAFRTITPIDFSEDNRFIVAKEKIGYVHDGIWKTNLWVHDFETRTSWQIPEVRDAIINYWHNRTGVDLFEQRWDIYPLGFDKNNQSRILVCAYAYTGDKPAFLGTWSVDIKGERCELIDLEGKKSDVSVVGFKMVYDSYESRDFIEFEAKRQEKLAEKQRIKKRKARIKKKKENKKEYKRKLKQLKADYRLKLKEYKKSKKKGVTSQGGSENANIDVDNIQNMPDIDYEQFAKERNEQIKKQLEEEKAQKNKKKKNSKKDKK